VYAIALVISFVTEFGLVFFGTRAIVAPHLLGQEIPIWAGILLRAASEGSAVTVAGLLIGDFLIEKNTRIKGFLILVILCAVIALDIALQAIPQKAIGAAVASRREMTTASTLVFLFIVMAFDAIWLWKADKASRRRGIFMVLAITAFTALWTACQYLANTRWIEVGIKGGYAQASPLVTFIAFVWDILPETSLLYLPFLAIPYIFGMIKPGQPEAAK
jgi:hypothetical protein